MLSDPTATLDDDPPMAAWKSMRAHEDLHHFLPELRVQQGKTEKILQIAGEVDLVGQRAELLPQRSPQLVPCRAAIAGEVQRPGVCSGGLDPDVRCLPLAPGSRRLAQDAVERRVPLLAHPRSVGVPPTSEVKEKRVRRSSSLTQCSP